MALGLLPQGFVALQVPLLLLGVALGLVAGAHLAARAQTRRRAARVTAAPPAPPVATPVRRPSEPRPIPLEEFARRSQELRGLAKRRRRQDSADETRILRSPRDDSGRALAPTRAIIIGLPQARRKALLRGPARRARADDLDPDDD